MWSNGEPKQSSVRSFAESVLARALFISPPLGKLARRSDFVIDDAATPLCRADDGILLLVKNIYERLNCGYFNSEHHGGHHNMNNGVATSTEKTGGIYISEGQ